jgi:hypothetical protein
MIRAAAILSSALLAATLGAAQTPSKGDAASGQSSSSGEAILDVQGCLSSSSFGDNHFTLTQDQTGTVFTLSGQAEQLRAQVGHEVEVTAKDVSSTAPEESGDDEKNENGPVPSDAGKNALEVTSVRVVADHCTASSMSPPGASPNSVPQSSKSGEASSAPANHHSIAKWAKSVNEALARLPNPGSTNSLPEPPPVLPLLGMVGLCSLVTGFLLRK